ncbi:hypothetical protein [Streptomyces sp. NBC_00239]|uniref:hypothetical protein n=1 Tax=Streptomyces sp. NBC_00239 TaxID=2903640 RepID=UPI002E27BD75|nr:hypothetical protein [Streptomyces sp. NBC_00239]
MGYQLDTGPVAVDGLPQDIEDTGRIITSREAVSTPAEALESLPPSPVNAAKPPEKPARMFGAFPDERPMIQRVGSPTPETASVRVVADALPQVDTPPDDAAREPTVADRQRVKLVGRIGRTPTVRETAAGKLVAKFPLAVHLDDGTTKWHDVPPSTIVRPR